MAQHKKKKEKKKKEEEKKRIFNITEWKCQTGYGNKRYQLGQNTMSGSRKNISQNKRWIGIYKYFSYFNITALHGVIVTKFFMVLLIFFKGCV